MSVDDDGDSVTEVTEQSWLHRLGQSFAGIIFGLLFIVGSCVLLFWNEGRAVTTARSLTEGAGLVQSVSADKVDPANEGKLVHVTATLTSGGPAVDGDFGMKSSGVRLRRTVEMFQWTEEESSESKKELGGSEKTRTTYKYKREWSDTPVDSSKFKHGNNHTNPQMTYRGRNIAAPEVKLGAFALPKEMLGNFGAEEPLSAGDDQVAAAQKHFADKNVQAVDGKIFIGKDPSQPAVGDLSVSFREVKLQLASVVARQAASTFEPYRTHAGGSVQLIVAGEVPAADMFKQAQADNRTWTWIIRAGGCLVMFIGFCLILGPIKVLADVIPILGDVVGAGIGLIGFLGTVILAPIVIAVAWFVYRPVVAVIVLVVGGALAYGVIRLSRQRKARKVAAGAAA